MSIINMNFSDAKPFEDLPEGEFKFRIVNAEKREKEETGSQWINVRLECIDPPDTEILYNDIYHSLFLPKDGDDEKRINRSLAAIGDFVQAFDIVLPEQSVTALVNNLEDAAIGCEGWGLVGKRKDRNSDDINTVIKRFLAGR